jgi:multidrug efflux pump subunit AcrB
MSLCRHTVHNRMAVGFIALVLALMGATFYRRLPLEAAPDITIPYVFVTTSYRGVAPEDIERGITIHIEKKLRGLTGVKKISSVSSEGRSAITVEFVPGVDINDALNRVKDKVERAKRDLPQDLEDEPEVTEVNLAEMPILVLAFSGPAGVRALTELVEDIADEAEGVPGVLEANVLGGIEREIQVQVRPERLALYAIPFTALQQVVSGENRNVSGGIIRTGQGRYQLRVPGEFATVEEVEGIVVAVRNGGPVYLRDLASVVDGIKDRESRSRMNGQDAVLLEIKKRAGENVLDIVGAVDRILERTEARFPPGTTVTRVVDRADNVRDMVRDLENNLLTGLVLVVLVVWLAMGLRNALLIAISVPLSMLLTFIVLWLLGITLNMIVLFSLTLAVGMLVDNAIVIMENAYRYLQQGFPRAEGVIRATEEVLWPIIGATLTTVVAFLPLLWWPGVPGEFMGYLPKTVIIVLLSCLFVALVVNPATAAAFMKATPAAAGADATFDAARAAGQLNALPRLSGGGFLLEGYRALLRFALRRRAGVLLLAGLFLAAALLFWLLRVGLRTPVEFFPTTDPETLYVQARVPQGTDADFCDSVVRDMAARLFTGPASEADPAAPASYAESLRLRERRRASDGGVYLSPSDLPDILYIYETSGVSDNRIGVRFVPLADRSVSSAETVRRIDERVRSVPGVETRIEEEQNGPPVGAPVSIEIAGDDLRTLGLLADRVKALVNEVPFVRNVRHDHEAGMPTLELRVNRPRAALVGLSTQAIGFAVKAAINGVEVSTYREANEDYDIVVRFTEADRRAIDTLERLFLPSPSHGLVPLTTVAEVRYVSGLNQVTRVNHKRVVTVRADVDETKTTGMTARLAAEERMRQLVLPSGYECTFTGEDEMRRESTAFLVQAAPVALLLILLVLVVQFNSVLLPLIILSSVLLSLSGAFLGLGLHRLPFGIIMCGIGVISLAGVVVNNAIVLLSYAQQLQARGMPLADAIVAAGATRLRPVFLTAVTTILGLAPMIVGISVDVHTLDIQWASESAQWWRGMSVVTAYGLGIATVLTLFVVPVLYYLLLTWRSGAARLLVLLRHPWRRGPRGPGAAGPAAAA